MKNLLFLLTLQADTLILNKGHPTSRPVRFILSLVVLCLASVSCVSAAEPRFSVAVGLSKPPYIIQGKNSGFEIELVRKVLESMGKSVEFVYVAFKRSQNMLRIEKIDAVMTTNQRIFEDATKLSDVYITYQNIAISLTANQFKFETISDLGQYTIASFQNAKNVLGSEFSAAASKSPLFLDIADQERQPALLIKKRVDVVVMDKNIFKYLTRDQEIKRMTNAFTFHYVFPSSPYRMAFKDSSNVAKFNRILKQYINSKDYQHLLEKYKLNEEF
jgi:polar amino acid transport system substrate-binding protein